jgi:hypothetical protein
VASCSWSAFEGGPGLEITLDVENADNLHEQIGTVMRDLVS